MRYLSYLLFFLAAFPGFLPAQNLIVESKTVQPGSTFQVNLQAIGFQPIGSMQGTVSWNGDDLFLDPNSPTAITNLGLSTTNNPWTLLVSPGILKFGWTDPSQSISVGENFNNNVIFRLEFTVLPGAGNSTQILLVNDPVPLEFATGFPTYSPQPFSITQGTILINSVGFPVTWLGFEANKTDDGIALRWETAQELNNDFFEVERRMAGGTFEPLGRLQGAGTSDEARQYEWLDRQAPEGRLEYRLRQVDLDGGYAYSSVVEIWNRQEAFGVYPVPTRGEVHIALPAEFAGGGVLTVKDLHGHTLQAARLEGPEASIDLSQQASGWYHLDAVSSTGMRLQRSVVKVD